MAAPIVPEPEDRSVPTLRVSMVTMGGLSRLYIEGVLPAGTVAGLMACSDAVLQEAAVVFGQQVRDEFWRFLTKVRQEG